MPLGELRVRRGRCLALSPDWGEDEPSALFDRHSGDYWIIGRTARHIITRVLARDMPQSSGAAMMDDCFPALGGGASDFDTVAAQLIELGVLEASS
ncbi:MAG: hypothetical protein KDG55_15845 [Rhodocyclaceae bacterium]|nr:hypothetical protein [Rhodocyclaceae bacterium]